MNAANTLERELDGRRGLLGFWDMAASCPVRPGPDQARGKEMSGPGGGEGGRVRQTHEYRAACSHTGTKSLCLSPL